ncbi:PREDICTED: chromatin accessibility complex protein 1 isoform X2 [Chinchilla lanigera]|uniref:chromatin accessibility complex protein 1 isoform X2 n=1 Tax=Chinchilla lanigera TaxID=34839 RepID=UPI000696645C|nr:PREDICTED: chromatin accessibility complex protein 1 isoform X2 [Chinchilla lanigera]
MADVAVGKDKCGEQRLVSLPLSRIRVIMKSSPEVSSINQEALVLTAKATMRKRPGRCRALPFSAHQTCSPRVGNNPTSSQNCRLQRADFYSTCPSPGAKYLYFLLSSLFSI